MIGRSILHYKIIEELGSGGMGTVYKAEDTRLERTVVIKFFPRLAALNPYERNRFKREAKAAACLNHPNITTIYDLEEVDEEMFIMMEFIDGQDLRKILGDVAEMQSAPPLQLEAILHCAIKIVEGLQATHEKG